MLTEICSKQTNGGSSSWKDYLTFETLLLQNGSNKNAYSVMRRPDKLMKFTDVTKHAPGIFGSVGPWTVEIEEGPLMEILCMPCSSAVP